VFKSNQSAKIKPKSTSQSNEEYSTLSSKSKRPVAISLGEDDYNFFFEYLIASLKNRNYLVRNLVSKSLICVLPNVELSELIPLIMSPILSKKFEINYFLGSC
jgi:hypothetical protein